MGGVCCKGQGWRVGEDHKGGKKQEDEERGDGVCPECGGKKGFPCPIKIFSEERDKLFFAIFKFRKRRVRLMRRCQVLPKKKKANC